MMSRRCFSLSSAASTTDVASNPTKQEQAAQKFLIHKGRSKDMIQRSPALSGVSLAENWSADATRALKIAIDKLGTSFG